MVLNEVQGSDGGSVSIANLPKGIYLLRANRQTVKINGSTGQLIITSSKGIIDGDKQYVEIKGEYAMEIPVADIDTVLLVEKLPSIRTRANGISTRKVNIGIFKMSDGNKCRLYINKDVPLFVEIKCQQTTDNGQQTLVFINRKTVEDTKTLYEEIFNSIEK